MRLIDVDAVRFETGLIDNGILFIPYRDIAKAPTVDAEPVRHGYWIEEPLQKYPNEHIDICSECESKSLAKYSYCPNCGAKME